MCNSTVNGKPLKKLNLFFTLVIHGNKISVKGRQMANFAGSLLTFVEYSP